MGIRVLSAALFAAGLFALPMAARSTTVDVVDVVPASVSFETWQTAEPTLAVNPANHSIMAISALAWSFVQNGSRAPIFVTNDGGKSWVAVPMIPGGPITKDVTLRFSPSGRYLYLAYIRFDNGMLNIARTPNVFSPEQLQVVYKRKLDDQPFLEAVPRGVTGNSSDEVLVANNDVSRVGDTAALDSTLNGALQPQPNDFLEDTLDTRDATPQDGPSVRTAVGSDGTVYEAFFSWHNSFDNHDGTATVDSDIVVERDDSFRNHEKHFQSLISSIDHKAGVVVVPDIKILFDSSPAGVLGSERIGSALSIAVDPRNSKHVYLAWSDGDAATYAIHLRRSLNGGVSWSEDLSSVPGGTNPSLAVTASGAVGLLSQAFDGTNWTTAVAISREGTFADKESIVLSRALPLLAAYQPFIGDYDDLRAVGDGFVGVFSANNTPSQSNFPSGVRFQRYADLSKGVLFDAKPPHAVQVPASVDPFFFSISAL